MKIKSICIALVCFIVIYVVLFWIYLPLQEPERRKKEVQNEKIIKFIHERALRDTLLSYKTLYLGMNKEDFHKSNYYIYKTNNTALYDTIVDNKMNWYKTRVDVFYIDSIYEIKLELTNPISSDVENFKAIRDLYIEKYGPFSIYHEEDDVRSFMYNSKGFYYTPDKIHFYADLLSQSNDEINDHASRVSYIWCWANCFIILYKVVNDIYVEYKLYPKDIINNEIDYSYLNKILPPKSPLDTISNANKQRIKKTQSI